MSSVGQAFGEHTKAMQHCLLSHNDLILQLETQSLGEIKFANVLDTYPALYEIKSLLS